MLTDIYLKTSNLKAGNFGDPVWTARVERGGIVEHHRKSSASTQMRLLPLALIEGLKYVKRSWPNDEIVIHCRNEYLILGMLIWRFDWAARDWCREDGEPLKHRDLWPELHALAETTTLMFADAWLYENRVLASEPGKLVQAKRRYAENNALLKARQRGPYSDLF